MIDVIPTILEVIGIPAPVMVDGAAEKPIEGVSMAYTFDKANANAPTTHKQPVLRDNGRAGAVPRWLDAEHCPDSAALAVAGNSH